MQAFSLQFYQKKPSSPGVFLRILRNFKNTFLQNTYGWLRLYVFQIGYANSIWQRHSSFKYKFQDSDILKIAMYFPFYRINCKTKGEEFSNATSPLKLELKPVSPRRQMKLIDQAFPSKTTLVKTVVLPWNHISVRWMGC